MLWLSSEFLWRLCSVAEYSIRCFIMIWLFIPSDSSHGCFSTRRDSRRDSIFSTGRQARNLARFVRTLGFFYLGCYRVSNSRYPAKSQWMTPQDALKCLFPFQFVQWMKWTLHHDDADTQDYSDRLFLICTCKAWEKERNRRKEHCSVWNFRFWIFFISWVIKFLQKARLPLRLSRVESGGSVQVVSWTESTNNRAGSQFLSI